MKKTLCLALLAACALAPAQSLDLKGSLSHLGGTMLYDPAARRPVVAMTYEVGRLTSFLGRRGLDLSLSAVAGAQGQGAALGVAALYARDVPFRISDELRGKASLLVGPALIYASDGGRMRLGAVAGISFRL